MSKYTFNAISTVHKRRSFFDLSHGVKTSMTVGKLYPLDVQEILPGDTFKTSEAHVVRLSSSYIRPVMDNVWLDVYYFFVPSRLIFDKFPAVFGENKESAWSIPTEVTVPTTTTKQTVSSGSVADYLGLPLGQLPDGLSILPFRAFALIYDEWFRNENVIDPMLVQKGDYNLTAESLNNNPWSSDNYTGMLPNISKKKDYFTSCLPSPQKGDAVTIGASVFPSTNAPVVGSNALHDTSYAFQFSTSDTGGISDGYRNMTLFSSSTTPALFGAVVASEGGSPPGSTRVLDRTNLVAAIPDTPLNSISVNDLRLAFQTQRILELDARGGTRYREYLLSHFGVSNADSRMQVPEFLGGKRTPLNTMQVAQTAQGTGDEALATLGAFSYSGGRSGYGKSFTEHGYVFAVGALRQMHTYQQGIEKFWYRSNRYDFYDPLFAYIGEQPVYSQQLYADPTKSLKQDIFGYNEAWAEYRYRPSYITGHMRTGISQSLDVYHFGDFYENAPVLSQEFIEETPIFFNRTVSVPSTSQDNFIVDMWFNVRAFHVMPVESKPGLIDHTY